MTGSAAGVRGRSLRPGRALPRCLDQICSATFQRSFCSQQGTFGPCEGMYRLVKFLLPLFDRWLTCGKTLASEHYINNRTNPSPPCSTRTCLRGQYFSYLYPIALAVALYVRRMPLPQRSNRFDCRRHILSPAAESCSDNLPTPSRGFLFTS